MVWKRLLGPSRPEPSRLIIGERGQYREISNPLPKLFPTLYEEAPDPEAVETIRVDAQKTGAFLLRALRIGERKLATATAKNVAALAEMPLVARHLLYLRRDATQKLYKNVLAVDTLLQLCAFHGTSDLAARLRAELAVCLLAVGVRYIGYHRLPKEGQTLLLRGNTWDLTDARQKELRDQYLESYRDVADHLSRLTCESFPPLAEKTHRLGQEQAHAFYHILRASWRLRGRTAVSREEWSRERLHPCAGYLSVLHAIASGLVSGKRAARLLAEEWGRLRSTLRHEKREGTTAETTAAFQALSDLFRLAGCVVLRNFQNRGFDAVHAPRERIIVREEPAAMGELKEGSDRSVRRYLSRDSMRRFRREEENGEGSGEGTEEGGESLPDDAPVGAPLEEGGRRVIVETRWRPYRVTRKIPLVDRSLADALAETRNPSKDPADEDLEPLGPPPDAAS